MSKHWVRLASVGSFALLSLLAGCADTTSIVEAKSPQTASPTPATSPAPAAVMPEQVVMGPTEGASSDPAILAWQNDLLRAVGREGQHSLFSLMLIEDRDGQAAYVGIDPARLGMTAEERAAADASAALIDVDVDSAHRR